MLLAQLGKLPARQRAILVLRFYEGCDDSDVAAILGISPVTVRAHASRALAALRIQLSTAESEWVAPKLGNGQVHASSASPAIIEKGCHHAG